jgi:hypothetical protein
MASAGVDTGAKIFVGLKAGVEGCANPMTADAQSNARTRSLTGLLLSIRGR